MNGLITIQAGRLHEFDTDTFKIVAQVCNRVLFGSALPVTDSDVTVKFPFGSVKQLGRSVKKDLLQEEKHLVISLAQDNIILTKYCTVNKNLNKKIKSTQDEKNERLVALNTFLEKEALNYKVMKYKNKFVIQDKSGEVLNYQEIKDMHVKNLFKLFMATLDYSLECGVVLTDIDMLDKYKLAVYFLSAYSKVPVITTDRDSETSVAFWY